MVHLSSLTLRRALAAGLLLAGGRDVLPGEAPTRTQEQAQSNALVVAEAQVGKLSTASAAGGRFVVRAADATLARSVVELIEQAGRDFDSLLPSETSWRAPVEVTVVAGAGPVPGDGFSRGAVLREGRLVLQLEVRTPPALTAERLMSAVAELLVYELSLRGRSDVSVQQELPQPPWWLTQGVSGMLTRSRHREFSQIVHNLVPRGKAPTVAVMQGWQGPAPTKIEEAWREAFSFWVVKQLAWKPEQRRSLAAWIAGLATNRTGGVVAYWPDPVVAQSWWETCLNRSMREPVDTFLGLEETQAALYRVLPTTLQDAATGQRVLVNFDRLADVPPSAELKVRLEEKAGELARLIERGDAVYRSVPTAYLRAVQTLLKGTPESRAEFAVLARQAVETMKEVDETRAGITDFLNWVQVTESSARPDEQFEGYFNARRVIEQAELVPVLRTRPPALTVRR